MKLVKTRRNGTISWGTLENDQIRLLAKPPYDGLVFTGETVAFDETKLEPPCDATKIVAIGKSYYDHAVEMGGEAPAEPIIFLKPPSALNRHLGEIVYPAISARVDYECELALVIKKTAKNIQAAEAHAYILGYTCLNDITARDLQQKDGQWARAKGFDTFCPIGPILTDEVDPSAGLSVQTFLNGVEKQSGNTKLLMWPIPELLARITAAMTLYPGDIVTTGTPAGIGPMEKGDVVAVSVAGIGTLQNTVV